MIVWLCSFFLAFFLMEFVAWALHKYVMHGPLWRLHEDHHAPVKGQKWQKNDLFAIFFAVPSFFAILFGNIYKINFLEGLGYGVTAYGIVYFLVHEVVIHRRWKLFNWKGSYIESIRLAHQHHHQVRGKEGAENFGMLLPPSKYFTSNLDDMRRSRRVQKS